MQSSSVIVDLEEARRRRRAAIFGITFAGLPASAGESATQAVVASEDDLIVTIAEAILAGAETVQIVYKGGSRAEADAALARGRVERVERA
jgi:hypothetical protein